MQGSHWTTDNTSNNYSMMKELGKYYRMNWPNVSFNSQTAHIFCFSHVINIIIQHILAALDHPSYNKSPDESQSKNDKDSPSLIDVDDEDEDNEGDQEEEEDNNDDDNSASLLTAVSGMISKVCCLVWTIRTSGLHQEALERIIVSGNGSGLWTDLNSNVVVIQPHQLILDVKTYWDSMYQMCYRTASCLISSHLINYASPILSNELSNTSVWLL